MSKLSLQIDALLTAGKTYDAIVKELGCSRNYIWVIKNGSRKHRARVEKRADVQKNPITPDHSERVIRLLKAGASPWEIKQLIPDVVIHA